jgi:hypothetical protein
MSGTGHFYRIATILRAAGLRSNPDVKVRLAIGLKLADSGRQGSLQHRTQPRHPKNFLRRSFRLACYKFRSMAGPTR